MSITKIVKRDGNVVFFNEKRIFKAIEKAFLAVYGKVEEALIGTLTEKVVAQLNVRHHARTIPAVEEIQDAVEQVLMEEHHGDVAKAYILYREQRNKLRDSKALMLDIEKTMQGYLGQEDWRVNENSSVNYSLGGLILHNSGTITANYWLNNVYDASVAKAHKEGDIHIHDLSMLSGYCAGWSLRQLLELGFGGVKGKINSLPAKHFSTAVWHAINFIGTMQNEWAGAQALASFDTYLSPFIKKENLSYKEVKQHIQSFVYSANTPSRWGTQPPFLNITLDWVCPKDLKNKPVIIGGQEDSFCYGDCEYEMRLINKAYLEVMLEGDANGRGFSYPIPTYNITEDFNWEGENVDLLFQMTAKYGTPTFLNFINSDLDPSEVRSMCCRLMLDKRELRRRGGGLFGADEFTGSIGVVTLNMPRIGYLSKTEEDFFNRVDSLMDVAKNSLELKRKTVQTLMDQNLFPYTKRYLKHFNNHFSTIGLIGMHECCLNFMGKSIAEKEGHAFTEKVLTHMRERLRQYQEETGNLYNLEATPAEATSYRLAKIDKARYSDIIHSGEEDPYYTNSSHLPVDYTDDLFHALSLQEPLQRKYTGGTVFHAFLGESLPDHNSCKTLVRQVLNNFRIPALTIAPTFSVCETHGRVPGKIEHCPTCGGEMEIYSRITGYYRAVKFWNKGKKAEFKDRRTYDTSPIIQGVDPMLQDKDCGENLVHKNNFYTTDRNINSEVISVPETTSAAPLFFYSDDCVKCKPIKTFLHEKDFQGQFINVSENSGLEHAKRYQIRALPALVTIVDKGFKVIQDDEEIKKCASMAL